MTGSSQRPVQDWLHIREAKTSLGATTDAPWKIGQDTTGQWLTIHNDNAEIVCILKSHQTGDAKLITAAPAMRDMLLGWLSVLQTELDDMTCDAGNFDGGSPDNCEHCAAISHSFQIIQLLRRAGVFMSSWLLKSRDIIRVVEAPDQWVAWDTLRDRPAADFGLLVTAEANEDGEPIAVRTEILMTRWGRDADAAQFHALAVQQGLVAK